MATFLNSQLLPGPKLQLDICNILMYFRFHAHVVCADVKIISRQILICEQLTSSTNFLS